MFQVPQNLDLPQPNPPSDTQYERRVTLGCPLLSHCLNNNTFMKKEVGGGRCCHYYDSCSLHVCPFFSLFRCQLINSFHSWSSDSRAGGLTHLMPGHSATEYRLLSSLWNGHPSTPNNGHSSVKDKLVPPQHSWAPHLKSLVILRRIHGQH